jgi:hypothetical protein
VLIAGKKWDYLMDIIIRILGKDGFFVVIALIKLKREDLHISIS